MLMVKKKIAFAIFTILSYILKYINLFPFKQIDFIFFMTYAMYTSLLHIFFR